MPLLCGGRAGILGDDMTDKLMTALGWLIEMTETSTVYALFVFVIIMPTCGALITIGSFWCGVVGIACQVPWFLARICAWKD